MNACFLVTCCTSIPNSLVEEHQSEISTSLLSALTSCKPSKVSWKVQTFKKQSKEILHIKMIHDLRVCAWISMHFGDKHQQEKLPCMLYYRLAYTLHSFSREPRNIEISYLKIAPRIVKMFMNIKHVMCVLLLLVCTSTPSSWISTCLLCLPKHCEEFKSAMATHFCTLVLFDCVGDMETESAIK